MWNRTNQVVSGIYMGIPYQGVVASSRVKYGGEVQHTVDLFNPIIVHGDERDCVLLSESDAFSVDYDASDIAA